MIGSRVLRAQLRIQSHRFWLSSFVAQTRPTAAASPESLESISGIRYGHVRFIQQKAVIRKTNTVPGHTFKKLRPKKDGIEDSDPLIFEHLREALENVDISEAQKLYLSLKDRSRVRPNFFRSIAQRLHHTLRVRQRSEDAQTRREQIEELSAFAETLVGDVIGGRLASHCQAHVHLLGFFKESGSRDTGVRFWQWLQQQDALHVNADVYGAAIELLAVNGAPLAETEALYAQALERFPGNFSAYHLSPEAIVPDRTQRTTLPGVPVSLFQGILTARLLCGDARNGYLAMDTALRLYPDQVPPRFFQVFLEERPILEAYSVFAIACRSGIVLPANQFRQILGSLRTSSDLSDPVRHGIAVRSMLSTMYMYLGAGGQISTNVLNEIVIAVTQFLRVRGVNQLEPHEKQILVTAAMDIIRSLFVIFARYGVQPGYAAFNSIITNLGGFGHSAETITVAIKDMHDLGLKPNAVTRRSILTAAGILGDGEFVVQAWNGVMHNRMEFMTDPDATDLHVLIKNAARTGQMEFAASEFEKYKTSLPEKDLANLEAALEENAEEAAEKATEPLDFSRLCEEIESVVKDILIIDRKTQQSPQIQDFSNQPLPTMLLPNISGVLLPEKEMRSSYDQMTAEPASVQEGMRIENEIVVFDPAFDVENSAEELATENDKDDAVGTETPTEATQSQARSSTGLPFDRLRHENWKSMNYLLELSTASDEAYLMAVDNAIAAGIVPPQRTLALTLAKHADLRSYGLSDTLRVAREMRQESAELDDAQIQGRKDEILRLRGRLL